MPNWATVTDLGNAALLSPAAGVLLLWLAVEGRRHQALAWASALGTGVLLVAASKIAFMGWGIGSTALRFTGASGHTMMATAVFFMLGHLLGRGRPRWQAALAIGAGCGVGLAVGVSRIALGCHSPSEVAAGGLIGLACAAAGRATAPDAALPPLAGRGLVAAGLVLMALLLHDVDVPTHDWLRQVALMLSGREGVYAAPV